jgi:sulfur-carrier protein
VPTVRYFAAARAAAGVTDEVVPTGTLEQLLDALARRHGQRLAQILKASSFLLDGVACREPSTPVLAQSTVDILPPFAGG